MMTTVDARKIITCDCGCTEYHNGKWRHLVLGLYRVNFDNEAAWLAACPSSAGGHCVECGGRLPAIKDDD